MLYAGQCRRCGFQVYSIDCTGFKRLMAQHLNKSHGEDYEFVSQITLKDFDALGFRIDRVHDPAIVKVLLGVMGNRGYWKAIRLHPPLQNLLFSGLSSGENSLSEILRLHSARG